MGRRYYRKYRNYNKTPFMFWLVLISIVFIINYPILIPVAIAVFIVKRFLKNRAQIEDEQENYHDILKQEVKTDHINLTNLPYAKKTSQITDAEMNFYKVLEEVVAGRFDIQRQVLLSTLVTTTSRFFTDYSTGRKFNPDRSKIDRLTIDFVLFNKQDLSPYLAIELDDKSHLQEDRIERDDFVEEVLSETGIKLVRIKNSYSYSVEEIDKLIG